MDANGDGVGDFIGLTRRLDYLHGLGVTAIWLMPFQSSPHRDDGYDVSTISTPSRTRLNLRSGWTIPDKMRC
jgi:pullulanase/glycogen debranching enzyme